MQLTLMLRGAHSTATARESPMTPERAATVCAISVQPVRGHDDDVDNAASVAVIAPALAAACIMNHVPFRLVFTTAFQPLTEKSIAGCGNCPPALLISMSTRPCVDPSDRTGGRPWDP